MARPNTLGERFLFSVSVTQETAARLDRLAEMHGSKRAQVVRLLIAEGLERHERLGRVAEALEAAS